MLRLERLARLTFFLLILAAGIHSQIAVADIAGLADEGWHTWQVESVESAPDMCCFAWRSGDETRKQCDLDGRNGGYSSTDDSPSSAGNVQVFAFVDAGVVTRIRALSTSCPVVADSKITDLGPVSTDDSVDWLENFVRLDGHPGSDAISAIAVHAGAKARDVLLDVAKPGNDDDKREEAIFWMAQARIDETADEVRRFIFDDETADIRKHAAFSYSQSSAPDITEVLVRQGRNDRDPDVRSQAWFWLAQTESDESEKAIRYALLHDADDDVREEAVFALSQLPENRAVKALAAILEDRQLSMDIREQALFWLAQTESDEAYEYIDRLLSDN